MLSSSFAVFVSLRKQDSITEKSTYNLLHNQFKCVKITTSLNMPSLVQYIVYCFVMLNTIFILCKVFKTVINFTTFLLKNVIN